MTIPTWKIAEAKMSVGINGAFIPFNLAPKSMRRFIRPALFSTGYEEWELQISGTAVLCCYKGLSVAFATNHQTGDGTEKPLPGKFVVLAEAGDKTLAIPPKNIIRPLIADEVFKSLQDLHVFDFEDVIDSRPVERINLDDIIWSDDVGYSVDYSFLIGYPSKSVIINTDDEGQLINVVNRWVLQDLQPAKQQLMDVENRNIFIKHDRSTRLSIDPDGLSGSPVFSIVHDENSDRYIRFDGLVTDAIGDRFAVYPSERIRDFMDQILAERLSP